MGGRRRRDDMKFLLALCLALIAVATAQYNYDEVLHKSILFYEAERSGWLPGNNRVHWRGNSATNDRGDNGVDLVGGWYDAGDHVKFGFPMAWTTTTLAWSVVEFRDAYAAAGELNWVLDSIKWPLDYFMKCHVSDNEFYGQLGNGHEDHAFWGRPEDMQMWRPAYKITAGSPGSDLAGETAAAMAAGSIAFRQTDSAYADRLLDHARRLFEFAWNHRGRYTNSITNAQDFYGSSGFEDELAWGALWLARATGDNNYVNRAREFVDEGKAWAYSWDAKNVGAQLLMFQQTGDGRYSRAVETFLRDYMPGGGIHQTPRGLAWRDQWGPLRYSANAAFIALVAADAGIIPGEARNFARQQIHYMLGDGGRSYVVGFGNNPPQRPHHRAASCPWRPAGCSWNDYNNPGPNPQVLNGALVGGPGQWDDYDDRRDDYIKNEVACDYNAGFQGAVAGLKSAVMKGNLKNEE